MQKRTKKRTAKDGYELWSSTPKKKALKKSLQDNRALELHLLCLNSQSNPTIWTSSCGTILSSCFILLTFLSLGRRWRCTAASSGPRWWERGRWDLSGSQAPDRFWLILRPKQHPDIHHLENHVDSTVSSIQAKCLANLKHTSIFTRPWSKHAPSV